MFLRNRTGSLIELKSGSQSSLYHLLVPRVLLLTWDCYSSPVAITFFLILLLLFSHYSSLFIYYSSFYYYYCSPIITALSLLLLLFSHCSYSFPVAVTFLTRCCSFHVMKAFNYNYLIIKTDFN